MLFFAVQPVHTGAIANVMGRAELYAAIGYAGACLVYIAGGPRASGRLLPSRCREGWTEVNEASGRAIEGDEARGRAAVSDRNGEGS